MQIEIPKGADIYGFVIDGLGAHSGRTIMLDDMRRLLDYCPIGSTPSDYKNAIKNENILLKNTGAARQEAFSRIKRLYGLDETIGLFHAFRILWDQKIEAQPTLLILFALTRDPILRVSVDLVLETQPGATLISSDFEEVATREFGDKLSKNTLASTGRNIASSWTQSGHFHGRSKKIRQLNESHPITTTYALFIGYLCGFRGQHLFNTKWTKLLDIPYHALINHAQEAFKLGWLDYKQLGDVVEISFNHLMREVNK